MLSGAGINRLCHVRSKLVHHEKLSSPVCLAIQSKLQLQRPIPSFLFNMKSAIAILVQAASLATALTRGDVSYAEAEAICGDLGVLDVPFDVDPYTVRACNEHPSIRETDVLSLEKRKCWYGSRDSGCSKKGWCFRNCDNGGTGAWCWTTVGGPLDSWKSCKSDNECGRNDSCGGGGCKKCGCGC